MGFEFNYKINGRNVSQKQWLDSIKDEAVSSAMKDVQKDIHREVAMLRCPIHGERPTIKTQIAGSRLKSEITACCDEMVAKAQKVATRQA